ncbi:unnamed protein product [Microthlaspi erraticum]|uniref:F-box domain-containing protein n=1 Tax=Microthlaspi erraticum TaxID=1685480 RepID=A0A6D2JPS3_9BRAS|nr:unnamed protein product [Microthlaspi erraticum]CAA7060189.1 unnamed protein product [Microthlaspi erraticum]
MGQIRKRAHRRRREEGIPGSVNWSELCPDLLRRVFERLSFTVLNRAKSVCSSWHSASKGCIPNRNQIPWLIIFPNKSNKSNTGSCVLFVPEDKDKVYKTRDLGVEFAKSRCLMTCGSWLLMSCPRRDVYMINPLTGERIDLPNTGKLRDSLKWEKACFWIDNETKDYIVIWRMAGCSMFIKKGDDNKWHEFPLSSWREDMIFNPKNQKLYLYHPNNHINIWDFSGDKPLQEDGSHLDSFCFNHYDFPNYIDEESEEELYWEKLLHDTTRIAVTVSGQVLMVASIMFSCKTWHFRVYKRDLVQSRWVKLDSLGNQALIYDMGITVVAKGIPGIKRNSIYFSGRDDPDQIFVYHLSTQKMQTLPPHVFSSVHFSHARWFLPS